MSIRWWIITCLTALIIGFAGGALVAYLGYYW